MPRIDDPNCRHQEGLEVEHDSLLLDQAVLGVEEGVLGKAFDYDTQKRSCEEKTQGILEGNLVLISSACLMALEVHQMMDDGKEHELIEEHDEDKS